MSSWAARGRRHRDWPVVYTLNDKQQVYVGETLAAAGRLRQHLDAGTKTHLDHARVIIDQSFNKSACLDLEAFLIRLFAGEGQLEVLNANVGVANSNYYRREDYRQSFREIFDLLRDEGLFATSIEQIQNSDLFKLSPFKSLTAEQSEAVASIVQSLLADLTGSSGGTSVVEGDPGTGKTVVAVFLMKMLRDIGAWDGRPLESESLLEGLFTLENASRLAGLRIGLVVPQQSLRSSIRAVFRNTPGLDRDMVLSPFDVGQSDEPWDLLIVDEAHRLGQRSNQTSAVRNRDFVDINVKIFGQDSPAHTQLDWIKQMSHHQLLLVDVRQRVKPGDLSVASLTAELDAARTTGRLHRLRSQMRVSAGGDYVSYVRSVLSDAPPATTLDFGQYDVRFYDDVEQMLVAVKARNREHGLARVLAGYAWEWKSKRDRTRVDIAFGDIQLRWNTTIVDWVDSPRSVDEVGSIHTIQGYDLNYAGVIIGRDLRLDPVTNSLRFDRNHYFDKKGKQNNPGQRLSDDDLLEYVANIYSVLLTRGIRGTYLYVVDEHLREYMRGYFTPSD
ncbi:DNA/RNA helicase domain-containing protein [Nocardioides sp. HDW12B]|uniref:DNA/RNA helicase domain-containing protein n=1 Tax=Nocardioides sp. HDW12B TaxID=2714939 RepID=UPI00197EB644|nr:DNA/RNA helicase domain-containing protein [Nocardioides sp. HDW12B]